MSPPSSSPPAGVPGTGNNAKYAIVAVLLIVGIGAMVVLRNFSSKANAPAPLPVASVPLTPTPPANPKLEDIPPPPPPEDSAETKKTGPRIVYVQAAGCDAKCVGQPSPDLGPALQVRAAQARRCYNSALAQDSTLKGKVTIAVRIGPSGNVCSAAVASNDMGSPNVANCAANIFRASGGFPSPRGGCVEATVPMNFVPLGQ
jgi:outer membrane biosynthesis protein TonB